MGPLERKTHLALGLLSQMIFTLDESFTPKFNFEKSRLGRAAEERQPRNGFYQFDRL